MTRTRLIVWNCVILTLLLAAIGAAIYVFTRQSMLNAVDAGLKARANFLTRTWRGPMDAERLARARERLPQAISAMSGGEPISPEEIRALQIQRLTAQTIYFDLSGIGIVDPSERPRSPTGFEAAKKGELVLSNSRLGEEPARTIDVPLRKNGQVLEVAEFTASLAPVYAELARPAAGRARHDGDGCRSDPARSGARDPNQPYGQPYRRDKLGRATAGHGQRRVRRAL